MPVEKDSSPPEVSTVQPQRPLNSAFLELMVLRDLPGILRGTRSSALGAQFIPRNHFISSVHIQYAHNKYIIKNY